MLILPPFSHFYTLSGLYRQGLLTWSSKCVTSRIENLVHPKWTKVDMLLPLSFGIAWEEYWFIHIKTLIDFNKDRTLFWFCLVLFCFSLGLLFTLTFLLELNCKQETKKIKPKAYLSVYFFVLVGSCVSSGHYLCLLCIKAIILK